MKFGCLHEVYELIGQERWWRERHLLLSDTLLTADFIGIINSYSNSAFATLSAIHCSSPEPNTLKKRVQTIKGTVAHANITASKQSSSPPFFRDISHSLKPLESLFLHVWVHFANSSFPLWCFSLIFLLLRFLFQYFLLFHISVHFLLSWFRGVLLTQYFSISNILLSFFFVTLYFKTGIKCFLTNVHFWLFLSPFIFPPAALLDLILVLFTWIRFSPFLSSFSLPFW